MDLNVSNVTEFYVSMNRTRQLTLACFVFLLYDALLTMPAEVRYIWNARWSFARIAFYFNRVSGLGLLLFYLTELFTYHSSNESCLPVTIIYLWGTVIVRATAASVLVMRVWALYNAKGWLLGALCLAYSAFVIPCAIINNIAVIEGDLSINPYPQAIPGCRLRAQPLVAGINNGLILFFESIMFVMVALKTWKSGRTPLMVKLMHDAAVYYVVVMIALLFLAFGFFTPQEKHALSGSGVFTAVASSMCSRLILSGLAFYDEQNSPENSFGLHSLPR
ncbi:hypothetical protein BDV93DRAFT_526794 [Ceratobasidium sp. AG-I]|nr:hypothetical protein BDV93DRAFT_526794 [Ceratobasidium sp. AG-I]